MVMQNYDYLDEVHICPHCKEEMSCCEAPQIHVGDGLGWGSDVLFICLNDACSLFLKGWENIDSKYGHHASYRYMELPRSKEGNVMMVGNKDAFKASVIDKETIRKQNKRYHEEKEAIAALDSCVAEKNLTPVLTLLLDEAANREHRRRAMGYLLQLNDLSCIDPIRNHQFRDSSFEQETNLIIDQLLKNNFKKECPYCLELIKKQAKKCKHCQADL